MVQQPQMSRSALFWVIMQRVMGRTGCPETSVRNYHYTLRNRSEEHSSHLLRGESLKPQLSSAESLLGSRRQSAVWQDITVPISTKQEVKYRCVGTGTSVKRGCIVTYKFSCVQITSTYVIFVLVLASLNILPVLGNAATGRRHTFGHVTSAGWLCSEQVMHKLHGDFRQWLQTQLIWWWINSSRSLTEDKYWRHFRCLSMMHRTVSRSTCTIISCCH